jgi:murein DD-endopeptidase MepM/ murein hydrolase activator NlpD
LKRAAAAALTLLLGGCATVVPPAVPPAPVAPPAAEPVVPPPPQTVAIGQFGLSGTPGQGALLSGTVPQGTALLMLDGKPVRFAPDGRFIIGFGRDAAPNALLEARLQDGRLLRAPLTVAPRTWDISSLPTLPRGTSPSAEYQRIRAAEVAQIEAARAQAVESDGWRTPFRWPALGRISTLFGSQRIYAGQPGAYHGGLDIAKRAGGAELAGTPARSPADGVVVLATDHPFSLEGNMVMIGHGYGLVTVLMHLSRIDVATGDRVTQGQAVGLIGMTGRATGPHLHWGMTWNRERIDPLLVAGPMPQP